MIILDTNALITFLQSDKESAEYKNLLAYIKQINHLTIGLPMPALSEFIAQDDNEARSLTLLKTSSRFKNLTFDEKSAVVAAKIYRDYREILPQHNQNQSPKQKVKVDIQILGIAVANNAKSIATCDNGIKNIINNLGLSLQIYDYRDNTFIQEMTSIVVSESNRLQ